MEFPEPIRRKQACINVIKKDDQCFKWAVLSALYPVEHGRHPERVNKYKEHASTLNFDGIEFPVSVNQIPKFKAQNDISINVFGLSKKDGQIQCFHTKLPNRREKGIFHFFLLKTILMMMTKMKKPHISFIMYGFRICRLSATVKFQKMVTKSIFLNDVFMYISVKNF